MARATFDRGIVVSILTRPRWAGAPLLRLRAVGTFEVSILTRPRWAGARSASISRVSVASQFQSSPARGGRVLQRPGIKTAAYKGFNPHPPEVGGCSVPHTAKIMDTIGFNPHPPEVGGCSCHQPWSLSPSACFNPHPPEVGGCSPVSSAMAHPTPCFNPHPPEVGGCSSRGVTFYRTGEVSILTRPRWAGAQPPQKGGCLLHVT